MTSREPDETYLGGYVWNPCACKRPCRPGRGCHGETPAVEVVTPQTVILGDVEAHEDEEHPAGDAKCEKCWSGYPKSCDSCSRGLVHAIFGDEGWDDYWLITKCDKCGEPE